MAKERLKIFAAKVNGSQGEYGDRMGELSEAVNEWLEGDPSIKIIKEEALLRVAATGSYSYVYLIEKIWYEKA